MRTEDLIDLLSHEAGPAQRISAASQLLSAALAGGIIAASVVLATLGLIPDDMFLEPGPWIKITYAFTLALAAGWLLSRLGIPGASDEKALYILLGIVASMGFAGMISYLATPEPERATALLGHSWLVCPWAILGLSLPVMVGAFRGMKKMAPTKLVLAGGACGLFSGAVAGIAYALVCTEVATPFIALWYTLGIALCGAVGAFLGPRLLNW